MVPLWVTELADVFWEAAGVREPFPRALRRPIARALQMVIISLPRLRLQDVTDWLRRHDIDCPCGAANSDLHACLAAWRGWGYVFLDGADPEDEQRLSLAHELAHFLRHYWHPRWLARRKFGAPGPRRPRRAPPPDPRRARPRPARLGSDRLSSAPAGSRLGGPAPGRDGPGRRERGDRLAYELLAPADEVLSRVGPPRRQTLEELLRSDFGLPAAHASCYGDILFPPTSADPLLKRLGLV